MDGIADYEFVRSLGDGNHGEYFLAKTPGRLPVDAELVAVKVLSGSTTQEVFRRATRELAAFAAVPSEYLVTLFDAGQQGGVFYYSMEYLPDGSLAEPNYLPDQGATMRAVAHAARAAHALHEAGIVHRDIKPGNVLLHSTGGKLSDLGLSQVIAPGMTLTGMGSMGSIEFVDPAVLHGEPPSRASDIYALGVTLHHALAGHGLHGELPDHDPVLALRKVLSTPPTVSEVLDDMLAELVGWAIDPDRTARPASALAYAERIESLVAA